MCNLYNVIIVILMKEKIKILAAVETPGQKGTKPYFIKNLPSRVEVLEGQTFCFDCYMGRRGCKPWFVKPLPHKIEVWKGRNLEMKCLVGYPDRGTHGHQTTLGNDEIRNQETGR